jgi:hypothetical protein
MGFITLRQVAAEFRKIEAGGDPGPDFPITEAYAMLMARQGLNLLLKKSYWEHLNEDDRSGMQLIIASYTVNVLGEDDHKYVNLPEFYLDLPFNKGLKGVAPVEEPTQEFIPRHTPEVSYNLDCADAEQQRTYYQEGTRIFFDKELELGKVLLKLRVGAPDSILPDSPLPMYSDQLMPLIQIMRQIVTNQPVQDKIADGNKDIGVRTPR